MRARLTWFRSSFQTKLFLIFTLLTALISLLFTILYIAIEIREERQHISDGVRLMAHHLADSVRLPLYAENREALQHLGQEVVRLPQIRKVVVRAADGRVLADVRCTDFAGGTSEFSETVDVRSTIGGSLESIVSNGPDSGEGTLVGTVTLERGGSDLSRKTLQVILLAICFAIGFWIAVSFLSYLVLRKVTRSFRALMQGVQVMQAGDYVSRIEVLTDDEPGRAANAINELAESLRRRDEENRTLNENLVRTMALEVEAKDALAEANRYLEAEITERIKAERAVRENEQALKLLLDFMPVGIAWTDPDGGLKYLNHFFTEHFGYGIDDVRSIDEWFDRAFSDPDQHGQAAELRRAVRERQEPDDTIPMHEARVTCKDGTHRHVLFKTKIFNDRHIIVLVDITDRELFQEQLVKTQKLESLGVLAGGIAHNFNNVLTGVLGYISYARRFLDESHRSLMPLMEAEKASKRAAGMANQLLTFARGGTPLKKPVSVRKLIDESVSLSISGTSVHCALHVPADLHAVKGDEGQLSQVFNNIIINAVQAMPGGGRLNIRAENVSLSGIDACHPANYVKLSFSDQGGGISPDNLDRVFDPYFTTKPSGTGLGLASVHSIVYKHGGQIKVKSVVGEGTTFIVLLPAVPETAQHQEAAWENSVCPEPKCCSILVMDDEKVIRDFARESLGFLGYNITTCANGEQAIDLYQAAYRDGRPYTAAILDLTISCGMGGADAARRILEFDPDAKLIVSSGYSYDPVMAEYRNYGFLAAVTKPYKADEICHELSLLQRR